jgi:hypothetical protein
MGIKNKFELPVMLFKGTVQSGYLTDFISQIHSTKGPDLESDCFLSYLKFLDIFAI